MIPYSLMLLYKQVDVCVGFSWMFKRLLNIRSAYLVQMIVNLSGCVITFQHHQIHIFHLSKHFVYACKTTIKCTHADIFTVQLLFNFTTRQRESRFWLMSTNGVFTQPVCHNADTASFFFFSNIASSVLFKQPINQRMKMLIL